MARRVKRDEPSRQGPSAAENRERLAALGSVAEELGDWRPQAEVLVRVEAVPTVLVDYDYRLGVGGHPIGRITLIHGPSGDGKTEFLLALGLSFLARGHFFGMVDAERTTPQEWVRALFGDLADHPGFVALPASSYEGVRKGVRRLCDKVGEARAKGRIPPDTTGIIGVDSIRKLVPEKLWDNLQKSIVDAKKDKGIDGFGGRAGQMKAALNAAWVDELVPLMADTRMAIAIISRETKLDEGGGLFGPTRDWKTGGGSALFYDSSLDVRVRQEWLVEGDGKDKRTVGERRLLDVHKLKVAGKQVRVPRAAFHVSNGADGTPPGLDPARDLLALGVELGSIELRGSSYRYDGRQLGAGKAKALAKLRDLGLRAEVEAATRALFGKRGTT
jgi:RecA/RadA recombinase